MVKLVKAAAYVRMSSDQQEGSPEQQREAIKQHAENHNYRIVQWYEDLGISGDATTKRTDFQKMIADGSVGDFGAIVCWDQDRFGRFDLVEAGRWIYPLQQSGVILDTVTGGKTDWNNLVDQLTYMAKQMGKAGYLRDLSANVKRGQTKAQDAGKWVTGFPPFGYAVDPETRRLVPADAKTVRTLQQIFERYAAGDSLKQVAAWLNELGILTTRGNKWQQRAVTNVLNNERYLGYSIHNQSTQSKYLPDAATNGKRIFKPRKEWTIIPNTHEALISRELFDVVQSEKVKKQKHTGPNSKNQYPLTQLLYCGSCGEKMSGTSIRGVRQYICSTYNKGTGGCDRRTVKEPEILTTVLKQIRTQLIDRCFGKAERKKLREEIRKLLTDGSEDQERQREHDAKSLQELDAQIEKAVTSMIATSEDLRPLVEKRVRELQDQRDAIAHKATKRAAPPINQVDRIDAKIDAAMNWLDKLETLVQANYNPEEVKRLLAQLVDRVEVDIDRVPESETGKRYTSVMTGGRIYFATEKLFGWSIPDFVKLCRPSGRWWIAVRGKW